MKYIISLQFVFFISIVFSPYKYSQVKYINQFEKDRWSTLEIYSAWDICRKAVNKWEWSNEKISRYHCSCLMDWQRIVIHEIGVHAYDPSKDFDKALLKEKAKKESVIYCGSIGRFPLITIKVDNFMKIAKKLVEENKFSLIKQRFC